MSSRSRALVTSAAVSALVFPLLAAPSVGAAIPRAPQPATWGPVRVLAANVRSEAIAVDAAGTVTVVWATGAATGRVVATRRSSGGRWSDPVVIGHGSDPQVATDGSGTVTAAWITHRAGITDGVAVARRPADGGWTDPVRLSTDRSVPGYPDDGESPYGATELTLAVNPAGDAVLAWAWGSDDRGRAWRVQSVHRRAGGRWTTPAIVTPADGSHRPQVGVDAAGNVLLLYARQRFGHPQVLRTRTRTADGLWSEPVLVTREGYSPTLAVDLAGDAVVAFSSATGGVAAAYRPAGGDWGRPRSVSPEGVAVADFSLAMNAGGTAVLAVGRANGRVDVLRRPTEGPWSAPERVIRRGATVYDVLVAVGDAGDIFLGWGAYALLGAYLPHGGTWGEPVTLSPETQVDVLESTEARIAPGGDVAVLWRQEDRPLKVRLMDAG